MRPDWDLYFIRIAKEVASRSTCKRAAVGAVIVKDNYIISTGYNGAPAGMAHCEDVGCDVVDGHCKRTVHAETNAILNASRCKKMLKGATLYYWDSKGRYAGSIDEFKKICKDCGDFAESVGIARICGRGL